MRIALAQINSVLGDFRLNKSKILESVSKAAAKHCDLVVLPEAALFGYHPVDLLERLAVVEEQERELKALHKALPKNIAVLVGAIVRNPTKKGKAFWNAAVFLQKNKKAKIFAKQLLPTYDVFDEGRHIEPGQTKNNLFKFKGKNVLVTICEDIWAWPDKKNSPAYSTYVHNPLKTISSNKVDLVLNLSASPFTQSKWKNRQRVTSATAAHFKAPLVYVNMVGAHDELIFDGASFCIDKKGRKLAQCARFTEDLCVVDLDKNQGSKSNMPKASIEILRQAIVLGLRDFVQKTGFTKVHLGLSGGIDSALVACLAADAIGPKNVTGWMLPSAFTSELSLTLATQLAKNIGIELREMTIDPLYKKTTNELEHIFGTFPFALTHENIQARLRGLILMAVSNKEKSLLLGTSNKSELAVGYSTLYGDMTGGLMPIGDALKTEVFALARHYNSQHEVIPTQLIDRPPTAELRPNQKDQDSLPPYEVLDPILRRLIEQFKAPKGDLEKSILQMISRSEFKRWQSPPILKISDHAFGRGRRFPVAGHFSPL